MYTKLGLKNGEVLYAEYIDHIEDALDEVVDDVEALKIKVGIKRYPLKITGAATAEYDGSGEVVVDIPVPQIDDTLTEEGVAADAKAVGEIVELINLTLNEKADKEEIPTTLPASDVYEWAKAEKKPEYTPEEVGALPDTTELKDLPDDEAHRTVSDEQTAYWNAKASAQSVQDLSDKIDDIADTYVKDEDLADWAKDETKPVYTYDEVGALPDTTQLKDLTSDEEHRTVTDTQITQWNDKSDVEGLEDRVDTIESDYLKKVDISDWAKSETKPEYTYTEVGALPESFATTVEDTYLKKTDKPNIADWALQPEKPTYTYEEVGALSKDTVTITPAQAKQIEDNKSAISKLETDSKDYTDKKVADLVGSAPETLDTLEEVAQALKDNEDVTTALNEAIGTKANKSYVDDTFLTKDEAYNDTEVRGLIDTKADKSTTYTKTEVDGLIDAIPEYDDTEVRELIDSKQPVGDYALKSEIPETLPASDVYEWAKSETKPEYTASEVGAIPIEDAENFATKEDLKSLDDYVTDEEFSAEQERVNEAIANAGKVKTVNQIPPDDSGNIDLGDAIVGIESIEQTVTSEASGGVNIVTIITSNGDSTIVEIRNGEEGGTRTFAYDEDDEVLYGSVIEKTIVDTVARDAIQNMYNKAEVNALIAGKQNVGDYALVDDIPATLPASDVYDWAKSSVKPSYTASEVGAISVTEASTFAKQSDLTGYATHTWVGQQGYIKEHQSLSAYAEKTYVDNKVSALVGSAPETMDTLQELSNALGSDPNFATTVATQIGTKADATSVYTKDEIDTKLVDAGKVKSVNGQTGDVTIVIPTTLPASDVYTWAKAENKPVYTANEVGAIPSSSASKYLDKTSTAENTLAGRIYIGGATTNIANAFTHVRKVTSSITGKNVNGACFAVSSDGTASFQHKTYNDDGSNAKNAAVMRFSNMGIQFAINTGSSSTPTEDMYKNMFYDGYQISSLNTTAKDIIGAINEISTGITGAGKVKTINGLTPDNNGNVTIAIPSVAGLASETWVAEQGYITEHQDISGKADKSNVYNKDEIDEKIGNLTTPRRLSMEVTYADNTTEAFEVWVDASN